MSNKVYVVMETPDCSISVIEIDRDVIDQVVEHYQMYRPDDADYLLNKLIVMFTRINRSWGNVAHSIAMELSTLDDDQFDKVVSLWKQHQMMLLWGEEVWIGAAPTLAAAKIAYVDAAIESYGA